MTTCAISSTIKYFALRTLHWQKEIVRLTLIHLYALNFTAKMTGKSSQSRKVYDPGVICGLPALSRWRLYLLKRHNLDLNLRLCVFVS